MRWLESMTRVFLFILFLYSSLFSSELIKISINKNHNLIVFAESLSDTKYVSDIPKKIFLKSNSTFDLKTFKTLHKKVSKSRIYKHNQTKSLLEALYINSLKHSSFKGFQTDMLAYKTSLNKQVLKSYFKSLKRLEKIYTKLIWDKEYKKLKYKKHQLEKIIKKSNYKNLILKIAKFYGVKKQNLKTMQIALYPLSKASNFRAFSIKNIETIGLYPHKRQNLKWLLTATVLHEISHTIYFKSDIVRKSFNIKNKKDRLKIIESFATAIGAGWGYEKLSGKVLYKFPWYNNKTYDKLSKRLFVKIKPYLDNNKTIDKNIITYIKGII